MQTKFLLSIITALTISKSAHCKEIQPLDTLNKAQREVVGKQFVKKNKLATDSILAEFTSKESSFVKPVFKEFQDEMYDDIVKGQYIFYSGFDSLVNTTFDRIRKSNSFLRKGSNCYISRDITLNAMSTLYDSYIINLGTFCFLRNNDEFAAIIAHEQAHNYLKHQLQSLKNSYTINKKESRTSIDEIKKSKYGRGAKALEKYKSILYENGKINRRHEFEADSLGYMMYRNAGYRSDQYLNAFELMMEYDTLTIKNLDLTVYKRVFNLPNLPFDETWLKQEDFSKYDYDKYKNKFDEDSISSHPELAERVEHLKRLFPELKNDSADVISSDTLYNQLRNIAFYEIFQSLNISEDYGFGVYLCLAQLAEPGSNTEPEMNYYKAWLGKYFTKIHQARKDYTLNKHLDALDPKNQSKEYQQFLSFMWNLRLHDLEQIALFYSKKQY